MLICDVVWIVMWSGIHFDVILVQGLFAGLHAVRSPCQSRVHMSAPHTSTSAASVCRGGACIALNYELLYVDAML
jgi:hypothetical protein